MPRRILGGYSGGRRRGTRSYANRRRTRALVTNYITNNTTIAETVVAGAGNRANFVQTGGRHSIRSHISTENARSSAALMTPARNGPNQPADTNRGREVNVEDDGNAHFREYATSGRAMEGTGRFQNIIAQLLAAEEHVRGGDTARALASLRASASSLSGANLDPKDVSSLAENHRYPVRACILYFCAALVQPGNSGTSAYILGLGKALKNVIENANLGKNFGIRLMEIMSQGISDSETVEKAFARNWIAFSCNEFGESNKALSYAERGIRAMEARFGMAVSPQYQVYCRLLLTAGEASHNINDYIGAATYYKRARSTLGKANDLNSSQARILRAKIKECRRVNNLASRDQA